MSYAIIKSGGKQYRAQKGWVLKVEKLDGEPGDKVELNDVLMLSNDSEITTDKEKLAQAKVLCEILEQKKDKKVMIYKLRRRKNSRRRQGHRQNHTILKVLEIGVD
jgi:large subunit ribosomal protein L21